MARDRLLLLLVVLCIVQQIGFGTYTYARFTQPPPPPYAFVLGPTGELLGYGSLKRLSELTNVCLAQVYSATDALLMRNPAGFARPLLLEQMFSPEALKHAQKMNKPEEENFARFFLTQRPDIDGITLLDSDETHFKALVAGKLSRHGTYNGQSLPPIPPVPFTLKMDMRCDPTRSARYGNLLFVEDFDYELSKP